MGKENKIRSQLVVVLIHKPMEQLDKSRTLVSIKEPKIQFKILVDTVVVTKIIIPELLPAVCLFSSRHILIKSGQL